MIFQMMPIAMAVLHNERFAREVAGLAPSRPGGPLGPCATLPERPESRSVLPYERRAFRRQMRDWFRPIRRGRPRRCLLRS